MQCNALNAIYISMSQYLDNIVSFHIVPDAAVVFEGAGSLLTFQAQLDGSWIVLLLQ